MTQDETDAMVKMRRAFEDASRRLDRIGAQVDENGRMTRDIYEDLYEAKNGDDGKPLIQRMRDGLRTIDRLSWLARIATWLSFAGGLLVVAARMIWELITTRPG